jgi:hypothetical protein
MRVITLVIVDLEVDLLHDDSRGKGEVLYVGVADLNAELGLAEAHHSHDVGALDGVVQEEGMPLRDDQGVRLE